MARKWNGKAMLLFGLYTFYYLVMELVLNDHAAPVIGEKNVTTLYGICYLLVGIGYPSYYVIHKWTARRKGEHLWVIGLGIISLYAALTATFVKSGFALTLSALVAHFAAGVVGGAVYYRVATLLSHTQSIGWHIGIAYASANLVQMLGLLAIADASDTYTEWFERIVITVAVLLFSYLMRKPAPEIPAEVSSELSPTTSENPVPSSSRNRQKYLLGALVSIAVLALMFGITDGIITAIHAGGGEFVAYGYPRFFVIPGLLFAGWVADRKNKSLFAFGTLAAMIIVVIAVLLFYNPESHNIAVTFVYFFASFLIIYSVSVFLETAPHTPLPALVAGSGRGVRYFFSGLAIIVTGSLWETASVTSLLIVYIVLVVLSFTIFFFMGHLQIHAPIAAPAAATPLDLSAYHLTARETEVLMLLLDGKSTTAIAETLFVSERTVRSHISNLLAKTQSKTRVEMITRLK